MAKPKTNYSTQAGKVNQRDFFESPSYAVNPLLPYLPKGALIWESAAGSGLLVQALELHGFTVIASELARGQDYFAFEPEGYTIQVTNPPFSRKYTWLKRACELEKPFALLMPADTLFAGAKAVPLILKYGIEVLLPTQRINFKTPLKGWAGSSAQFSSAWFCRGLGIGQFITYVNLNKPKLSKIQQQHRVNHPEQVEVPVPSTVQEALF